MCLGIVISAIAACGGGGGGGDGSSGGGNAGVSGTNWVTHADVVQNNCNERIAAVDQTFTVGSSTVYTGIVSAPSTNNDGTIEFGYEESNGDCTRTYTGQISPSGSSADVSLSAKSNCAGVICENKWAGVANKG